MSNILKFTNTDHMKPFCVVLDGVLRSLGIPQQTREEAVKWAEEAGRSYRIPPIEISVSMPDGLTDVQVIHLRNEIHREFVRYDEQLQLAKHNYIITEVKKKLGFIA